MPDHRNPLAALAIRCSLLVLAAGFSSVRAEPVTLESLLKEMVDRQALAQFPDPAYTCKQFSSYDPRSKTPQDRDGWFANGDSSHYLRVEQAAGGDGSPRKEWVMADMDGPGAVVRIWSADPKGTLRIYLDGAAAPAIEAPMADLLGGKWKIAAPLSQEVSRGWNLYLPIPYAKHCKITASDLEQPNKEGKVQFHGFYYQVNYRTYAGEAAVTTLTPAALDSAAGLIDQTQKRLLDPGFSNPDNRPVEYIAIEPGATKEIIDTSNGPGAVANLVIYLDAPDLAAALRSTILTATFDDEQTTWCPVGDFFGQVAGPADFQDFYRRAKGPFMQTLWRMPYARTARISLTNLGKATVRFGRTCATLRGPDFWTPSTMHFHAAWRYQFPIHAYGGRGTEDWNYLEATGGGVYVGDSLSVMNPVPDWWGEGDEKIYVDGETFPSHFGTGTEDYYGYAWCCPVPFQHPFHAEPRADGHAHGDNNWGYTTVSRVRALDAIPFTKSLKFDMEVWHWKECDEGYAATTFFYGLPGLTTNRRPQPDEAAKPLPVPAPLPPPFKIENALECEDLKVLAKSEGLVAGPQDMRPFAARTWSNETQLWVQGRQSGDFIELEVPAGAGPEGNKPVNFILYATRSWDYGMIKFTINGQASDVPENLYSGGQKVIPTGPIHLGIYRPKDGKLTLRAEVVGGDPEAKGSKSFFGLDCIVLTPASEADLRPPPGHDHDHENPPRQP